MLVALAARKAPPASSHHKPRLFTHRLLENRPFRRTARRIVLMRFPKVRYVRWGVAAVSGLVLALGLTGCGGSGPATPAAAAADANATTNAAPAPVKGNAKAKARGGVRVSSTPEEDTSHSVRRKKLKEQGR
jgi:hypothetical protein